MKELMNVVVRRADYGDAELISLLGRVTFNETFGHYFKDEEDLKSYHNRTFNVKKIRESIKKKNNYYYLAFLDELPVGYAKLKLNSPSEFLPFSSSAQLQKIYVLRDFLEVGIGYKLQEELLKTVILKGYRSIWLSVLNENQRAISFYRKGGFQEIGGHNFKIGKEIFQFTAMSKSINERGIS